MIYLKRIAISATLIAVFILSALLTITPLLAELRFNYAEKLIAQYKWPKAERELEEAIRIDPFNSQYAAAFGELLLRQGRYLDNKTPTLEKSKRLYEEALKLNPRNAEYAVKLGQVYLMLFTEHKDKPEFIEKAFNSFGKALYNDPNGFNVSYLIGYSSIAVWDSLNVERRNLVLDRIRYSLKLKPWYSEYIYPRLWQKTRDLNLLRQVTPETLFSNECLYDFIVKNNLWQFRRAQSDVVDFYRRKENPKELAQDMTAVSNEIKRIKKSAGNRAGSTIPKSAWEGVSSDGKNAYKNGDMYWRGTMSAPIVVPKGEAAIRIQMRGTPAGKIYPYVIIEMDGKEIGETLLDGSDWKEYSFKINTDGGLKVLSVTFVNDCCDKNEDRNLFVGEVRVEQSL